MKVRRRRLKSSVGQAAVLIRGATLAATPSGWGLLPPPAETAEPASAPPVKCRRPAIELLTAVVDGDRTWSDLSPSSALSLSSFSRF